MNMCKCKEWFRKQTTTRIHVFICQVLRINSFECMFYHQLFQSVVHISYSIHAHSKYRISNICHKQHHANEEENQTRCHQSGLTSTIYTQTVTLRSSAIVMNEVKFS